MFKLFLSSSLKTFGLLGLVFVMAGVLEASGTTQPLVTVTSYQDGVSFQVQRSDVQSAQVQIFDLTGRPIYRSAWVASSYVGVAFSDERRSVGGQRDLSIHTPSEG